MKKLVIALVAVAVGIAANAASVTWGAQKGYLYDGAGDSASKIMSGSAYLVLATYAQDDLVSLFASKDGDGAATLTALQGNSAYIGSATIGSNARISEGTGTTSATASIETYFVVFNGDKMYISNTASSEYDNLTTEHGINFTTSMSASSKLSYDASSGYSAAGWYAVPEPTSGLLMLLGMTGLALRRKRA